MINNVKYISILELLVTDPGSGTQGLIFKRGTRRRNITHFSADNAG